MIDETLPECVARLLWGVDLATLSLDRDRDFVIERIMSRGTWEAMRWLRRTYSREHLADFLRRKSGSLAPREQAYWCLIVGVPSEPRHGGGRPAWAG